jgi:hypothetical protein
MNKFGKFNHERNKSTKYQSAIPDPSKKDDLIRERVRQLRQQQETLDTKKAIEAKKDRSNLKTELDFVGNHRDAYRRHVDGFFAQNEYEESRTFAEKITYVNYEEKKSQISPEEIKSIIARIPPHLTSRSSLVSIDFEWQDKLPVPIFDENGDMLWNDIPIMNADDFIKSSHHPHRALIGYTAPKLEKDEFGETTFSTIIKPTTIPQTISDDPESVHFYQTHVFIHEFMHTIEKPYRDEESAQKWILNTMSGRTFADWTNDYARAVEEERVPGSYYASIYLDDLFQTQDQKTVPYSVPLIEWVCEDWVGTVLGIIPNDAGDIDFRTRPLSITPASHPQRKGSRRHELIRELLTPEIYT